MQGFAGLHVAAARVAFLPSLANLGIHICIRVCRTHSSPCWRRAHAHSNTAGPTCTPSS